MVGVLVHVGLYLDLLGHDAAAYLYVLLATDAASGEQFRSLTLLSVCCILHSGLWQVPGDKGTGPAGGGSQGDDASVLWP